MLAWLESLPLSVWVHESPSVWAQPTVLTLHTMGMAVLVGACWVLDLRLLGISRNVPLSAFRWVFRVVSVALTVNVVTGVLLVFIPMTGEYVIPSLLGGGKREFVGNAVGDQFLVAPNWPFGARERLDPAD